LTHEMDLYIYKRWKICAVDLRIVSELTTTTFKKELFNKIPVFFVSRCFRWQF
jgi:hypothetical protein